MKISPKKSYSTYAISQKTLVVDVMNYNRDVMIESGYIMRFRRTMITCSIDMDKIHSSALR